MPLTSIYFIRESIGYFEQKYCQRTGKDEF